MGRMIALALSLFAFAATAAATASAPPQDENWLMTSISGDRFEIAGGKIALARATTPVVRSLAQRLIKDHSKSLRDALELAHEWGMKGPPAATPTQQWQLNRLRWLPRSH